MESAIIAALVAAFISLIGFLVNLHIAKKTRKANERQLMLGTGLKIFEEKIKLLKSYNTTIEQLRISCWSLLAELSALKRNKSPEIQMDDFNQSSDQFREQFSIFFKTWADIKGDIPENIIEYLRGLRHSCKNQGYKIIGRLKLIDHKRRRDPKIGSYVHHIKDIENYLNYFLKQLDDLFSIISTLRNNALDKLIAEDGANKANSADAKSRAAD